MRDRYALRTPGMRRFAPPTLGAAPLGPTKIFDALDRLSHLDHLTELSLTFFMPPKVVVIDAIAAKFPRLRSLQLVLSISMPGLIPMIDSDWREEPYLTALRRLHHLLHLKISLEVRYLDYVRGSMANAAYYFLDNLPGLRTVSLRWQHYYITTPAVWGTWDRSLVSSGQAPPPPLAYPEI
ncbi:hypothetical protein B0H12DRAFT_1131600 [Mycena haematopus]|nr:hypothetical protein B0H12DRAFT_1131600 [Mycena haematopus]